MYAEFLIMQNIDSNGCGKISTIKNYEKSIKLNPQNTNAVDQLKKLK